MKLILLALLALTAFAQTDNLTTNCNLQDEDGNPLGVCDEGYFLTYDQDERRCLSKSSPQDLVLDNCVEHEWDNDLGIKCAKCANKFLVGNSGICVAFEQDHCEQATVLSGDNDEDGYIHQCSECAEGKVLNSDNHSCVDPSGIANCTLEDHSSSNFVCKKCNDQTHWGGSTAPTTCAAANTVTNCAAGSYQKVSDSVGFKCTGCEDTYILSDDGLHCTQYTAAVSNCEDSIDQHYNDAGTLKCKKCADPTTQTLHGDGSGCTTTPTTGQPGFITDCTIYKTTAGSAWLCDTCGNSKVLSQDEKSCEDPSTESAKKCQEWKHAANTDSSADWECKTCESTNPILNVAKNECFIKPTKPDPVESWWDDNCAEWKHDGAYKCKKCNEGYWLYADHCHKHERPIQHCNNWASQYKCQGCETGYTISDNRCYACPARKWVAPSTGGGSTGGGSGGGSTGGGTNSTGGSTNSTGGTSDPKESSAQIIAPVILVLLALLY